MKKKTLFCLSLLLLGTCLLLLNAAADTYSPSSLSLTGTPLEDGLYASGGNITTQNSCEIASGDNVAFFAEGTVTLSPGFRVEDGALFSVVVGYIYDSDSDGMADLWEIKSFGNLDQSSGDDLDSDGVANIIEYKIGTNVNDASDVPSITVNYEYNDIGEVKSSSAVVDGQQEQAYQQHK